MQSYLNLGGDSGVIAYEIGEDFIIVEFKDRSQYLYNYAMTGSGNVERMKQFAISGRGLNSYISRTVRKLYAAKLR
jgi:hypothetical protein